MKRSLYEKETYLSKLHTIEEDAYLVDLYPEIEFNGKFTELIYFGFKRGDNTIHWNWCYACAYTNDNRNVSAKFINLERDDPELLINTKNTEHRRFAGSIATPAYIKITVGDFPNCFRSIANVLRIKNLVPLAKKWDIASQIWHNEYEEELILTLFNKILQSESKILDCGCGTGFHSLVLNKAGFDVTSADSDAANIEILETRIKEKNLNINAMNVGWLELNDKIKEKFDCVVCLGSSITYYESWKEDIREIGMKANFQAIVKSFKSMLNSKGKLVLGISRHYDKEISGHSVLFNPKTIDKHKYNMEWVLRYDWSEMRKSWECRIFEESSGNDYSFRLVSHLVDRNELMELCREFFSTVECHDLDGAFYDIFIVCSND